MSTRVDVLLRLLVLVAVSLGVCNSCGQQFALGIDGQPVHCLPWTLFLLRRTSAPPRRDSYVAFRAHGLAPLIADDTLLVKQVAGLPGDRIEQLGGRLRINGIERARLDPAIMARLRHLPGRLERDRVLGPGQYLLLGAHPASFDSRYFGPVPATQLIAEATPLW